MPRQQQGGASDLLYGLDAIAKYVGLTVPQVKWQITKSGWPTFKQGAIVCARKADLDVHFASQGRSLPTGTQPVAAIVPGLLVVGYRAIAERLSMTTEAATALDMARQLPTYMDDGCTVASVAALDHWMMMKGKR